MPRIDCLVSARWVVPVVPHGVVWEHHAVAIAAGRIQALGPTAELLRDHPDAEHIALDQHVLLPGLVNAHTHAAMTLLRGLADDLPLMRWLSEHIWPTEARHVGEDFVRVGSALAAVEMLRGGITCANDMYFFPDVAAAALEGLGMRVVVGAIVIEFPSAWAQSVDEYFDKGLALIERYAGHPRVRVMWAPHAPYSVGDAALERIGRHAAEHDLRIHMHVHETAQEVAESTARHGQRPLQRLQRLGLLGQHLSAVHMTQLTGDEIALAAERGLSVIHCPESNMKLASGIAPIAALQRAGVEIALGTDGSASNNDLDLFGELRSAALLAKVTAGDAAACDAATTLRMATLGGARALGLEREIGSLEPGKWADLTAVRLDSPELQPVYHPLSHLVYAVGRQHVSDVWVGGRARLRAGQWVDIDVEGIVQRARAYGARIALGSAGT